MDMTQIAIATTTILAPFTPYLIELGKVGGEQFVSTIAKKGGDFTWEQMKLIWEKIKSYTNDDPELIGAMAMVAAKPKDEIRQNLLVEVLSNRLEQYPSLADEICELLGGQKSVQKVLADKNSWVQDIAQQLEGDGTQITQANDSSTIKGIKQTKK